MIHYYVHGRGRGHATRSRAIIATLRSEGYQVRVFAGSNDAASVLGEQASVQVQSIIPGLWPGAAVRIIWSRTVEAIRAARKDSADLIISDGDAPSCYAAWLLRLPAIAVSHGLVFSHCKRPQGVSAVPWLREGLKRRVSSVGARFKVAISFVPLLPRDAATTVAAPDVETGGRSVAERSEEIVCYFRDANGDRVLRWLVELGARPVVFAERAPDVDGIMWKPLERQAFIKAVGRCRCVVSSAGSNLIAECAAMSVPHILLYGARDDEQRLNSEMLERFGYSSSSFDALTFESLQSFVNRLPAPKVKNVPWSGLQGASQVVLGLTQRLSGD